ncbi:MAG: hypothetical protein KKA07_12255, partial [Bacteroidetes bacterium]|nr:hypothetical protein [Bacteroidota bacterium]
YDTILKDYPKDNTDRWGIFNEFIASEFAKETIRESDYEYLISALFTERLFNLYPLFDGVLYPSTRVGGEGFNIAIKSESIRKIRLTGVLESMVYKYKEKVVVDNTAFCNVDIDRNNFCLRELIRSEKFCMRSLGFSSFKEFMKACEKENQQ